MIGETLKKLRNKKGLTLKQMGDILGVSHMTYQRYEKGDCDVSTEMLKKLAAFHGVTTDYLLGIEKPEPSEMSPEEMEIALLEIYRNLPENGKQFVIDSIRSVVQLYDSVKEQGEGE